MWLFFGDWCKCELFFIFWLLYGLLSRLNISSSCLIIMIIRVSDLRFLKNRLFRIDKTNLFLILVLNSYTFQIVIIYGWKVLFYIFTLASLELFGLFNNVPCLYRTILCINRWCEINHVSTYNDDFLILRNIICIRRWSFALRSWWLSMHSGRYWNNSIIN